MLLRLRSLALLHLRSAGCMVHQLLSCANRQPLIHNLLCKSLNLSLVRQSQQGTSVTSGENTRRNATLHQSRQLQQTNRVRNLGARTTNTLSQLLLSSVELLHELLVCRRLFNGVQLTAVQVLQQGVTEQVAVFSLTNNRRDGAQASRLSCAPAALTHDQLILFGTVFARGTHDDRLQNTNLTHRVDELFHVLLIKVGSGLLAVRVDIANVQLGKLGTGNRNQAALFLRSGLRGGDIFTKEEVHRAASQGGVAQCRTHIHARLLLRCFT